MSRMLNLMGVRFGHWVAISPVKPDNPKRNIKWLCRCDCGTEKLVEVGALRSGESTSCGCCKHEWRKSEFGKELTKVHMAALRARRSGLKNIDDILNNRLTPSTHHSQSGVRGIKITKYGTYNAHIHFRGMEYNFGTYKTMDEAMTALEEGVRRYIYPHAKKYMKNKKETDEQTRQELTEKRDKIYKKFHAKKRGSKKRGNADGK